jgi:RHS repeat-associated protein
MQGSAATRDNVYLGSLLVGSYASCSWNFYASDHLGTPRLITDILGNPVGQSPKYWPFGDEYVAQSADQRFRFAGMERDLESDSSTLRYYDHARSHHAVAGRFLSPDLLRGTVGNPQTWNRYSYVSNNPLKYVDPTGLVWGCTWTKDNDGYLQPHCGDSIEVKGSAASGLAGGGGGSGGGGTNSSQTGANSSTFAEGSRVLSWVCSAIPSGRVIGASGGAGAVGAGIAGGELVLNYRSGQVSAFGFGGLQAGWNGVLSGSVYSGLAYGLNDSNSNYSGGFTGFGAGFGVGGFMESSSGGLTGGPGGLLPSGGSNAVTVVGVSTGASLVGALTFGGTVTNYTSPLQVGGHWSFGMLDDALYIANGVCR